MTDEIKRYIEKLNEFGKEYGVSISELDIELKRREHDRSLFGTVPQLEGVLALRAMVDKIENKLKEVK